MQFRVPQFIDIEDKIIGPLGWKQLAYIVAGLGLVYIIFRGFDSKIVASIFAIPAVCLFGALAFVRINNRDFLSISEDAVKYFFSDKIYTWQKDKNQKDVHDIYNTSHKYDTANGIVGSNNNQSSDSKKNINYEIKKTSNNKLADKAFDIDIKSNK